MTPLAMSVLVLHSLLLLNWSIYGTADNFPCGDVCECSGKPQQNSEGLVADCSRRNLRYIPAPLPPDTQYLDLSGNVISTLSSRDVVDLPKNLLVLDLTHNPLTCDEVTLRNLGTSITIKSSCKVSSPAVGYNSLSLQTRGKRTKRDLTSCQPGSPNCVKHICKGNEYWLPYATYWGCCKGIIHDLRETYCSQLQGVQNCSSPLAPQFKCRNGHCIPEPWLCNKVNDCQDGSDELGCDACNGTNDFRCWNGRCVPQSAVCDAYNDCGDGSDETFCRTLSGGWCTTTQYRCPTDVCIPLNKVCDGTTDCADKSDEMGCHKTSCDNGWKYYKSSCYKYDNHHLRWTDARKRCQGSGADLAKITSRDGQDFVRGLGSHQPFDIWIGLWHQAVLSSSRFVWTDGSNLRNFTFWSDGEPRLGQDVCVEMQYYNKGRWRTGECTQKHSASVCQKGSNCNTTENDCIDEAFEKPRMTSFPSEETITATYGSNVTVECKATGFPRPTVMLVINALTVYTSAGGDTVMAPYQATLTYTVTMSSDVECHISNRVGSSFLRMRINMRDDDSSYIKAVLRLTDETYTADLSDPLSGRFKSLAGFLEDQLTLIVGVRSVNVVAFRKGSVIADILICTAKKSSSIVTEVLLEAVETNKLGNVVLDSLGDIKACPKEFFNVTWSGTFEGEYATQDCPRGAAGVAKRKCLENGVWGYPDYGDCSSKEFNQLQEKMNDLFNSPRPSSEDITMVITNLSSLTTPQKYDAVMAGDIKISTQILQDVVDYNKKFSKSRESVSANVEGFLQTVSNLFDINNLRDFSYLQKTDNTTTDLTKITEDYGLQAAAGKIKQDGKESWVKDNIAMEAKLVPYNEQQPLVFPSYSDGLLSSPIWTEDGKQHITLPKEIFSREGNLSANGTKVASFLFRTLSLFLTQTSAYEQVGEQFQVESRVISSSVDPPVYKLVKPVVIVFGGIQTNKGTVVCVYWDYNLNSNGGGWSTDGCWLVSHKNGTVTCECDHLTNFAVLMDRTGISTEHEGHRKALKFITIIGCSLSLLGLLVTLILHLFLWRILKSPKTVIHVNLCIALLTANVLLLIGSASVKHKVFCAVISSFLHYFFLSAIFWMLAEGLQIYSSIVKVFGGEGRLKLFYFLGWGFPLLFVSICLAITRTKGYGGDKTCWLSISSGLIWTFIAPALTVVLINSVIFVLVIRAMMTSHKMMAAEDKEKIKLGIKCSVVLVPLLGITWVFGVLAFDEATVAFLYLFAIFNSLQGLFIFLFHCVFDQQVRSAVLMWKRKRQRTSYASAVETTQPKSKHISSGLTTERLPSHGLKMTDLTKQTNKQNKPTGGDKGAVNENYRWSK